LVTRQLSAGPLGSLIDEELIIMKIIAMLALLLISSAMVFSQKETLIRVDTVQISQSIQKMVFKYYLADEEYDFKDTKRFGRFEIYMLGENEPFQRDTLIKVSMAYYKDLNDDHIRDLTVVTMQATSGGGDYRVYYLYDPATKRFQYWRSDPSDQ
jgi:hypothetical protein